MSSGISAGPVAMPEVLLSPCFAVLHRSGSLSSWEICHFFAHEDWPLPGTGSPSSSFLGFFFSVLVSGLDASWLPLESWSFLKHLPHRPGSILPIPSRHCLGKCSAAVLWSDRGISSSRPARDALSCSLLTDQAYFSCSCLFPYLLAPLLLSPHRQVLALPSPGKPVAVALPVAGGSQAACPLLPSPCCPPDTESLWIAPTVPGLHPAPCPVRAAASEENIALVFILLAKEGVWSLLAIRGCFSGYWLLSPSCLHV